MAGIYFHVPFCRKKCTYCDFHFSTTFSGYRTELLELMSLEFNQRLNEINEPIKTIYFGGGSPGLLTPKELEMLLKEPLRIAGNQLVELTLEANPEDVTQANLTAWRTLGINRISLGIQSVNTDILRWMNMRKKFKPRRPTKTEIKFICIRQTKNSKMPLSNRRAKKAIRF